MKKWLLPALWIFFAAFLAYPLLYIVRGALFVSGPSGGTHFSLIYFRLVFENELYFRSFLNSFKIAVLATVFAFLIGMPLALVFSRFEFPLKRWLQAAMLIPIILPPFVGAIGLKQFFARFGSVNLLLYHLGLMPIDRPIDWFGMGGMGGIILMQVLHLFPILFLSVAAALANIDPSLSDAAENLGARGWRLFRTVTFPLAMPGIFAGAILVFVSAFTDLGTPIMFDFQATLPSQIFNASTESGDNPVGYALVVTTMLVVAAFFLLSRIWGDRGHYATLGRAATFDRVVALSGWRGLAMTGGVFLLLLVALLPHLGVIINSFAARWFLTVLPGEYSLRFYRDIFRTDLTILSIKNSLVYSAGSAVLDLVLGIGIAHLLARENFRGKWLLDVVTMLPLALPGLVLAFGYVAGFNFNQYWLPWLVWLNPRKNPTALLIVAYSVRRLPYIVRAAYAGYQQTSVALEEASINLGAGRWLTLRRITLPLIAANLVAGTILTFSFAMLEVSDSLLLAMESRFAPITKGIYELMGRPDPDASALACALGVLAMVLLGASLVLASRLLGKTTGQLFRA